MRLVLDVVGDVQLNRELLRVTGRAEDMSPAFARVVELWQSETEKQFDTEGRHASGGWKPLAVSTLAAKRRRGQSQQILRATDALHRSLTNAGDGNAIVRITPTELDYGSRLPYAAFHQRGTARMPQRRPVALTEGARRETIKIVQRFLITGEIR